MTHKKGETNNPNGRPKGTPNKITSDLRERINNFLNENWQLVEKDFLVLEPEKRVLLFEKLLQYTIPKMQSIDGNINANYENMSEEQLDKIIDVLTQKII